MFKPFSLNFRGRLVCYRRPAVMGILNVTDDSFFADSRTSDADSIARRATQLLADGADIIDIGACSTRPGAQCPSADEEAARIVEAIRIVRQAVGPEVPISVDTFRAFVAKAAIAIGADMINDIGGGSLDPEMFSLMAQHTDVPYVVMHTRGTPADMQLLTDYSATPGGVTADVGLRLRELTANLHAMGVTQVIVDPGFGFAKTAEQNLELLHNLSRLVDLLQVPMLVGLSRKSMFYRPLGLTPADVLPATTAAHVLAIQAGASILRVHDPAPARQALFVTSGKILAPEYC